MSQAIMLAKRGYLSVSPNPMVGCIIVKKGQIIGEGCHRFPGDKHAEIHALDQAGSRSKGSTVYVTLEPCCHIGRTGACTERLIKSQITRLLIASIDPNPQVKGKGVQSLQAAGILVEIGMMAKEAASMNKIFFYYHNYNLPYVIAKWGMSLDGHMVTSSSDNKQITNEISKQKVHDLRNRVDAIVVGSKTVVLDNPSLTVRNSTAAFTKHPLRIVLSTTSKTLPINAKIFNDLSLAKSMVVTSNLADKQKMIYLEQQGIECIEVSLNKKGAINLKSLLEMLARKGVTSLLVEGGRTLLNDFFNNHLVNEVQSYIAPVIIAELDRKKPISINRTGFSYKDYYCIGKMKK